MAVRRDNPHGHCPVDRIGQCRPTISLIKGRLLLDQRLGAIVADLCARSSGAVQWAVVIDVSFCMTGHRGSSVRGWLNTSNMRIGCAQFKHAGIGDPAGNSKQPQQQHRECGVALALGVRQTFHACMVRAAMSECLCASAHNPVKCKNYFGNGEPVPKTHHPAAGQP